jgi:hypothetical protein
VAYNFQLGNNKIKLLEDHQPDVVFQQDVREFLDMLFRGRWIGHDGPIPWPPRPPDIMPLDSFLWGYFKDIVYKTPVTSIHEPMFRIAAAIETTAQQMLENTWREISCVPRNVELVSIVQY